MDVKRLETENHDLKEVVKDIHQMLNDGILIRDISKDHDDEHYRKVSMKINLWVARSLSLIK